MPRLASSCRASRVETRGNGAQVRARLQARDRYLALLAAHTRLYREKPITRVVRNGLKGDGISRKSTTDTFLLLNMERGDHTHSYYNRGLMVHSKIDMISMIGRYCM